MAKSGTSATTGGGANNLLDGAYNEEESHQGFLEALNAWRGKPEEPEKKSQEKKVRFQDEEKKEEPKKSNFFANIDANPNFDMGAIPTYEEREIKPDASLQDKRYTQKESCWNCYKLFPQEEAVKEDSTNRVSDIRDNLVQSFCSNECFEKHQNVNAIKCQLEDCTKKFVKTVGHFIHGKWFCCEACSDKDPETVHMKELYEKGIEFKNKEVEDEEGDDEDYEIDL